MDSIVTAAIEEVALDGSKGVLYSNLLVPELSVYLNHVSQGVPFKPYGHTYWQGCQ
jgi:hypothetical protein